MYINETFFSINIWNRMSCKKNKMTHKDLIRVH